MFGLVFMSTFTSSSMLLSVPVLCTLESRPQHSRRQKDNACWKSIENCACNLCVFFAAYMIWTDLVCGVEFALRVYLEVTCYLLHFACFRISCVPYNMLQVLRKDAQRRPMGAWIRAKPSLDKQRALCQEY